MKSFLASAGQFFIFETTPSMLLRDFIRPLCAESEDPCRCVDHVRSFEKVTPSTHIFEAQTAKFTVFAREISSAVLKTWKTRKTKT